MRNLTSPTQFLQRKEEFQIEELINRLELKISGNNYVYINNNSSNYINVIVDKEFSTKVRDEVAFLYKKEGWKDVKHQTSSENKERSGLTEFIFYFP